MTASQPLGFRSVNFSSFVSFRERAQWLVQFLGAEQLLLARTSAGLEDTVRGFDLAVKATLRGF